MYTVPTKLQGKWYSMDKNRRTYSKDDNQLREIEFGSHTLTTEDHQYEIHIPDKEYFEKHQQFSNDYLNDTHTWVKVFNNTEALKGGGQLYYVNWLDS